MRSDPETGKRILSDATVNRTLGISRISMVVRSICQPRPHNRSGSKLKELTAQNLKPEELELIYQVAADSNLPKRNIALLSVLLHVRASEASAS